MLYLKICFICFIVFAHSVSAEDEKGLGISNETNIDSLSYYRKLVSDYETYLYKSIRLSPKFDKVLIDGKSATHDLIFKSFETDCKECLNEFEESYFKLEELRNNVRCMIKFNKRLKEKYRITYDKFVLPRNEITHDSIDILKGKLNNYKDYLKLKVEFTDHYKAFLLGDRSFNFKIEGIRLFNRACFTLNNIYLIDYSILKINGIKNISPHANAKFNKSAILMKRHKALRKMGVPLIIVGGRILSRCLFNLPSIKQAGGYVLDDIKRTMVISSLVLSGGLTFYFTGVPLKRKSGRLDREGHIHYDKTLRSTFKIPKKVIEYEEEKGKVDYRFKRTRR